MHIKMSAERRAGALHRANLGLTRSKGLTYVMFAARVRAYIEHEDM